MIFRRERVCVCVCVCVKDTERVHFIINNELKMASFILKLLFINIHHKERPVIQTKNYS